MVLLQRFQPPAGTTFVVLADKIFDAVTSNPSRRVDVVLDIYFDVSIKNAERAKRSSCPEGVKYKNSLSSQVMKDIYVYPDKQDRSGTLSRVTEEKVRVHFKTRQQSVVRHRG